MENKTIIGFAGRKRAGKTELCKHLHEKYNADIITIADSLKHVCCQLLDIDNIQVLNIMKDKAGYFIDLEEYDDIIFYNILFNAIKPDVNDIDKAKEIISKKVDKLFSKKVITVRELLQFVGTDIIRVLCPNWHVNRMIENINNSTADFVVIDDVRFPNEREAIENHNGKVFFIIRPDLNIEISNHSSETSLKWTDFTDDCVLINMYSLETLFRNFDYYVNHDFISGANEPTFQHGASQFTYREDILFGTDRADESFINSYILPNIGKNGCIVIHTYDSQLALQISAKLYKRYVDVASTPSHTFIIWNPFIIENMKAWL